VGHAHNANRLSLLGVAAVVIVGTVQHGTEQQQHTADNPATSCAASA
jgi:hypothetical protein